jgi:hypothetical protein
MGKKLEEKITYVEVDMSKKEIKLVLELLFKEDNKEGFYKDITIEDWAKRVDGLPLHLWKILNEK